MKHLRAYCFILFFILCSFASFSAIARSPLAPVKTDSPRDTMSSFMDAMNDYKKGLDTNDSQLESRVWDAVRTLNLEKAPTLTKQEYGKRSALLLKEVIDRVILIDPTKIPDQTDIPRWRLKGTEITIAPVSSGDQAGEYLFTASTVERAEEFYDKIKDLPYLSGSGNGAGYSDRWNKKFFPQWAQKNLFGIFYWQILGLFIAILFGLMLQVITQYLIKILKAFFTNKENSIRYKIFASLEAPSGLFVASLFWYFSVIYLDYEGLSQTILTHLIQGLIGASVIWAAYRFVDVIHLSLNRWAMKTDSDLDNQLVPMVSKSLRVFVLVFGVLLIIQNLGFNVMSLLAGLGLGGLALALAAKDTAANLFGSITILLDRPFRIGDWIKNSEVEGTVERIGFRSTRIRTFYNSLISIPNSTLATTNIDNMGLREYRRVRTTLGITYDTPPEKVEAFVEGVKNIILANPKTRKDYFHVVFNDFGSSSLNIMVYFFLKVPDWTEELVERQNIFIEFLRLAQALKVDFAFPTTTLHMETFPEKKPSVLRHQDWTEEKIKSIAAAFAAQGKMAKPRGLGIFKRSGTNISLPGDNETI
ncbi:MAG: mechanosensitive ion channel family protein [Bdellovibrionales bacterium]|nr:mechanosensitive ion channel family protein [Bdellovibrionales bacterium]